jgi:hypothetical protein
MTREEESGEKENDTIRGSSRQEEKEHAAALFKLVELFRQLSYRFISLLAASESG